MTLSDAVAHMTPASVRAWLKTQQPERTFSCGNPLRCAISKYLSCVTEARVTADYESIYDSEDSLPTPEWCERFMRRFDNARDSSRDVKSTLRILRECCPELAEAAQ